MYRRRHTITEIVNHSRSTIWERSVKYYWGVGWGGLEWDGGGVAGEGGLNRFYVAITLALSSAVV